MRKPDPIERISLTRAAILLLATLVSCRPSAARGQDTVPSSPVRRQLEAEARRFQPLGYALAQPVVETDLGDLQPDTVRVTLEAGRTYVVAGACDADCTDLQMRITDEAGRVVREKSEIEDPFLQLTVERTQGYGIVVAPRCGMEPCRVGVAIFVKQGETRAPPRRR